MTLFTRRKALALMGGTAAAASLATPALASGRKITVGALRFTSHSGSFIGFERGYFAEAGLDVEFKFFQAATPMAVAIASGGVAMRSRPCPVVWSRWPTKARSR